MPRRGDTRASVSALRVFVFDTYMTRQTCLLIAISFLVPTFLMGDDSPLRVIKDSSDRPTAVEATGWSKEELAKIDSLDRESTARWQQRLGIHVLDENGQPQDPSVGGS